MMAGSGIRIGDAERNAVAECLREHYAAGRLDMEEFQERLDAAFAAKTEQDLAKLTADLPHSSPYATPWPGQQAGQRGPVQSYPLSGSQQAPPRASSPMAALAAAAISLFILATVVILWLPFGGLPKAVLIILAVFAFIRRIFRRVLFGGPLARGRRR